MASGNTGSLRQVLLADVTSWETWVHLAGALRRRGVRVVRVTGRDRSRTQRLRVDLERVAFDRTCSVIGQDDTGQPTVSGVLPWLPGVSDVQMVDSIGAAVTASEYWSKHTHLHRSSRVPDAVLYDKVGYSRLAQAAGIPVSHLAPLAGPESVSLPPGQLVLKARVGSGGAHVRFIESHTDINEALQAWRLRPEEVFVQRAVSGRTWTVGGVARHGETLVSASYEARSNPDDPHGPAALIRILPHHDALLLAERFVDAVGYTGPFAIDFIDDGTPHMIDFNPRFFGSWAALQAHGVDLLGAYLATFGAPWSGTGRSPGARTSWMPTSVNAQTGVSGVWRAVRDLTTMLHPVVGGRVATVVAAESLVHALRPDTAERG